MHLCVVKETIQIQNRRKTKIRTEEKPDPDLRKPNVQTVQKVIFNPNLENQKIRTVRKIDPDPIRPMNHPVSLGWKTRKRQLKTRENIQKKARFGKRRVFHFYKLFWIGFIWPFCKRPEGGYTE
jgi:hypothetical protein